MKIAATTLMVVMVGVAAEPPVTVCMTRTKDSLLEN
jgi:hypothetical protein